MKHPVPDFELLLENARLSVTPQQMEQFCAYLALVHEYGRILNLTGFGSHSQLVDELVVESLRLLELGPIPDGARVIDLGSGNGSPVVALAVATPAARFTAVESRARRSTFLSIVKARLHLDNLTVVNSRVEDLGADAPEFDIVCSRAFAEPGRFLQAALELGGTDSEIRGYCGDACGSVDQAASALGLAPVDWISYQLGSRTRHVYSVRVRADSHTTCS